MVEPGGEEQRVRAGAGCRRSEAQSPEPVDCDRAAARAAELTLELAGHRVVGIDAAVSEVADQNVAAERAERGRRERHCPRRVKPAPADEPLEQVAVRRE